MKLHMAAWSRFSTPTGIDTEYFVPWLPGVFNPQVNLRGVVMLIRKVQPQIATAYGLRLP